MHSPRTEGRPLVLSIAPQEAPSLPQLAAPSSPRWPPASPSRANPLKPGLLQCPLRGWGRRWARPSRGRMEPLGRSSTSSARPSWLAGCLAGRGEPEPFVCAGERGWCPQPPGKGQPSSPSSSAAAFPEDAAPSPSAKVRGCSPRRHRAPCRASRPLPLQPLPALPAPQPSPPRQHPPISGTPWNPPVPLQGLPQALLLCPLLQPEQKRAPVRPCSSCRCRRRLLSAGFILLLSSHCPISPCPTLPDPHPRLPF